MTDDSNHYLSSMGKLLHRRAKKTKLFWLSCVPSRKQLKKSLSTVCDGQTQTTPIFHKTLSADPIKRAKDFQISPESCVVDSSRNILDSDSDVFMGSFDSFDNVDEATVTIDNSRPQTKSSGNCQCLERDEACKWRQQESAILDKLTDLQLEINQLRATVSSLRSGENDIALKSEPSLFSVPPPPPPMPPPPPPPFPSPVFHHSMSLTLPRRRQSVSVPKMHSDEMAQDRGKPIITLEELQNVKLRHVYSVANIC